MTLPVALGRAYLADTATSLYSTPADTRLLLKQLVLCNQDVVDRTVTFHNAAGAAANSNAFLHEAVIAAGATAHIDLSMCLDETSTLRGFADAADVVSWFGDGLEIEDAIDPVLTLVYRNFIPASPTELVEFASTGVLKHIAICNVTDDPHTCSLWLVPDAGTRDGENAVFLARTISAHTTLFMNLSTVVVDGATLHGDADTISSLTLIASSVQAG